MTEIDADAQALLDDLDRGRQAWIEGRLEFGDGSLVEQAPDMTIFGPFGGDAGSGGAALVAKQMRAAAMFRGGSGRSEVVKVMREGDLVVVVLIERNEARFEGHAALHPWILRTTQVFRRDGDRWIRLHRHADPLIARRPLADALALIPRE